jgi:hypothetical protein
LESWALFAQRVKDRFVPAKWRMDALAKFYAISQGSAPFLDFVNNPQNARNVLASAGTSFYVNDSTVKNHLLFFCNPILSLRIRSIPNFKYSDTKLDALIGLMASSWDTMVAERLVRSSLAPLTQLSSSTSCPPLSDKERDALKLAGGCFRCRKTLSSPGWTYHGS